MEIYYTAKRRALAAPNASAELILSGMVVSGHVVTNLEAQLLTPNSRRRRRRRSRRLEEEVQEEEEEEEVGEEIEYREK